MIDWNFKWYKGPSVANQTVVKLLKNWILNNVASRPFQAFSENLVCLYKVKNWILKNVIERPYYSAIWKLKNWIHNNGGKKDQVQDHSMATET